MKLQLFLYISMLSFTFSEDVFIYQVDCTQNAQWVDGKKVCSMHQNDVYISIQSDLNYKNYTVFKLRIQNISNDTADANPATMYVVRSFSNGTVDSIAVLNPLSEIEKSNKQIAESEEELAAINKSRNTEGTVVSIYEALPPIRIGKNKSVNASGTQVSNAIYQEKAQALTNKLTDAKRDKVYWETNALLASSIAPLNYMEKNIYVSMNHCTKALLHIRIATNDFIVPVIYVKL